MGYNAAKKQQIIDRWMELKASGDDRAAVAVKQEYGVNELTVRAWQQELAERLDDCFVKSAVLRNQV